MVDAERRSKGRSAGGTHARGGRAPRSGSELGGNGVAARSRRQEARRFAPAHPLDHRVTMAKSETSGERRPHLLALCYTAAASVPSQMHATSKMLLTLVFDHLQQRLSESELKSTQEVRDRNELLMRWSASMQAW